MKSRQYFVCGLNPEISVWKLFFQKVWMILNIFHIYDFFIRWIFFEIEPFEISHETHFFDFKSIKNTTLRVTGKHSRVPEKCIKSSFEELWLYFTKLITEAKFYYHNLKECIDDHIRWYTLRVKHCPFWICCGDPYHLHHGQEEARASSFAKQHNQESHP